MDPLIETGTLGLRKSSAILPIPKAKMPDGSVGSPDPEFDASVPDMEKVRVVLVNS